MSTVQETDPAAVAIASVETISAGDVGASLATFADDAVVNILLPGAPKIYVGREEIRAWLESLVAQHWEGGAEILQVEGDTVTTRLTDSADPTRALGVAPLVGTDVYIVQEGKITSYTLTPTDETVAKLQPAGDRRIDASFRIPVDHDSSSSSALASCRSAVPNPSVNQS